MRIAYFINQYPAISHTFIRREIQAIEALGVTVVRYALRFSPRDLVHREDRAEMEKTQYILKASPVELFQCFVRILLRRPVALAKTVVLAVKIGWRSDRGLIRHLTYAVEALVLATWCRRDGIQHLHAHFGTNPAAIAMLAGQIC